MTINDFLTVVFFARYLYVKKYSEAMNAMIINVQERRDRERGIHNHSKIEGLQRRRQHQ